MGWSKMAAAAPAIFSPSLLVDVGERGCFAVHPGVAGAGRRILFPGDAGRDELFRLLIRVSDMTSRVPDEQLLSQLHRDCAPMLHCYALRLTNGVLHRSA